MGTVSEETLGLYREGDLDSAPGVADLCGLLNLPETLGIDHGGKATTFIGHPDPGPDHPRPARRTDRTLPETEGRPSSTPYVRKSLQRSHHQPGPTALDLCAPGSCIFIVRRPVADQYLSSPFAYH
jgi:hypothetical protein